MRAGFSFSRRERVGAVLATLFKLNRLLHSGGRVQLLGLLLLALVSGLIELVGVGSILPFMAAASQPSTIQTVPALQMLYKVGAFSSTRVFLVFWGCMVLLALGLVNVLNAVAIWLGCHFATQQQLQLSARLFRGYLTQTFSWHLHRHSAALSESLLRARSLGDGVYRPLVNVLARGLTSLILIAMLMWVDPVVTAMTSGILFLAFFSVYARCRRRLGAIAAAECRAQFRLATTIADSLGALKHIQMTGCHDTFVRSYAGQVRSVGAFAMQRVLAAEVPRIILHALANAAVLLLVLYLEATLENPQLLIPVVSLYALAGYRMLPSLQLCLSSMLTLETSGPILDAIYQDLLDLPEADDEGNPGPPLQLRQSIVLKDVSFRYSDSRPALVENCTLEIPAGCRVGIVGATGLGKTTLLHLLLGLLTPDQGSLRVDGRELSPRELRAWRRSIGYVPQDVFLADATIAENIALGAEEVDPALLQKVAGLAALQDVIAQAEHGFDTRVGERGIRLSGGQRQRIGLARALYLQPQVLVLDEATSALDSGTEAQVMKTLLQLSDAMTMVVVAHRLSTVRHCDRIYVIGDGGVVASGTYDELLESSPEFQAIAPAGAV